MVTRTKGALLALVATTLLMGGGCRFPSDRAMYRIARKAARENPNFPENAVIDSMSEARIGVGKNAARVDLSYRGPSAAGETTAGTYTVWIKRVARRWGALPPTPTPDQKDG